MRPSATVAEAWSRLQPAEPDWDWETARIGGKLFRFGYCQDQVLVLVVTIHDSDLNRVPTSH